MMRRTLYTLALLTAFALVWAGTQAAGQDPQQQNPSGQGQAQQPAEPPPHVDQQTNPEARQVERSIQAAFRQDPHMAYSKVQVQASDQNVILTGTVLTATAKEQAAKIAEDQAGGRKIINKIRVNPNIHPGPGF